VDRKGRITDFEASTRVQNLAFLHRFLKAGILDSGLLSCNRFRAIYPVTQCPNETVLRFLSYVSDIDNVSNFKSSRKLSRTILRSAEPPN
jgi:hypothetical protein